MSRIIDRKYTQDFIYRVLSEADLGFYEDQGYLLLGRTLTDRGLSLMPVSYTHLTLPTSDLV